MLISKLMVFVVLVAVVRYATAVGVYGGAISLAMILNAPTPQPSTLEPSTLPNNVTSFVNATEDITAMILNAPTPQPSTPEPSTLPNNVISFVNATEDITGAVDYGHDSAFVKYGYVEDAPHLVKGQFDDVSDSSRKEDESKEKESKLN
uniref:Secreted protein n=1 Tax=Steinernema glaseri TaxID=37863 RepID=A0A1I8A469_9BILA